MVKFFFENPSHFFKPSIDEKFLYMLINCVIHFCLFFVQYISLLMDWVESQINNEDIFPIDKGTAIDHLLVAMFVLQK